MILTSCKDDGPPTTPSPSTSGAPDFRAEDVNPTSGRFGEMVSPRDYLKSVSAWYFGHAT
ncbi:MAG: hypothetical protein R3E12_02470 [Candidatus Eisenbacteria bacterium]